MLSGPGIGSTTIRESGDIDVHLVTHAQMGKGRGLPRARGSLTRRRRLQGTALALLLPPILTVVLANARGPLNLVSDVLLYLLVVVVVALVGGLVPAVIAAISGSLLLNYYFAPPLHTLTIREPNNALAIGVFVVVAALVSSVVDLAARRTRQAARAKAEADTLGTLAGSILRGETALPATLERLREALGLTSVTLLERTSPETADGGTPSRGPADEWTVVAVAGPDGCTRPQDADTELAAGDTLTLALRGRPLRAEDQRIAGAFAAQAAVMLERHRLSEAAAAAVPIAEGDRMRTALLAAVGHDLRTPLAAAKAAVTSLRSEEIEWSPQDRAELLLGADESLDRLTRLVDNLLDMSRLQAGALSIVTRRVALDEVVPVALDDLGADGASVIVDVPDDLPMLMADPGLLERVVANLVGNAIRYSPPDLPPRVTGSSLGDRVELRVIDRGPGIPQVDLDRVFVPFQRLGDTDNTTGVGLGLALSRGLSEAMGGTLVPEETPGGGLTMVLSMAAAAPAGGRGDAKPPWPQGACGRQPAIQHPVGTVMNRVLVVDDEPHIVRALAINLRARHYEVFTASNGTDALATAASHPPDLVILDLGLPDIDGVDVIRGLRGWTSVPIVILSGRTDSADKVDALDAGADDYLTKPFGVDELMARMRALARRATPDDVQPVVTFGKATVDLAARRVVMGDGDQRVDVRLTPTEWHLLEVLLRHPGKLMSPAQLLSEVWGPGYENAGGNLRVYMAKLRQKLEADPARPRHLLTEPGMGYRFEP